MDPNANLRETIALLQQRAAGGLDAVTLARHNARLRELRDELATWEANGGFPATVRVELAPHLAAWMAGDRYGVALWARGTGRVVVRMDRSRRYLQVHAASLTVLP